MAKHSLINEHVDKYKDFYHSEVDVVDLPFQGVDYPANLSRSQVKKLINDFNCTTDVTVKSNIADQFPEELFAVCRFCGKRIINTNSQLILTKKNKVKVDKPSVYKRVVDGVEHILSCCEDCLLEHFKDNPPKSSKYYYMKANKYGAYAFDLSEDEYKKICSATTGVTEKSMIRKHGYEKGKQLWESYCETQSKTNTLEYKQQKYGWTKEQFDEFNKSRAITLDNMILKYGKEEGEKKYNEYVEKQKITKSWDYMAKIHGIEKAQAINSSKALTKENFIRKYGKEEGEKAWKDYYSKYSFGYSPISQEFFKKLDEYLNDKHETYFATKNYEYMISFSNGKNALLDYFIKDMNIAIEFNGVLFHADPRKYKPTDIINPFNSPNPLTAQQIWEKDRSRYEELEKLGIKTIVIWESDYKSKDFNLIEFIKTNNLI